MNPEISSTDRLVDRLSRSPLLDAGADLTQPLLRKILDGGGAWAPLKDLLHGTWLGHPLHPAITDVPIGAWTLATVFDALELAGRDEFAAAADLAIGIGLAGAVAAVATGLAEWSDTKDEPKRLGSAHGMLNGLGTALYVTSLVLRRRGSRGAGIATAYAAYSFAGLAAYLGGELAYNHQLGVKHTARPIEPGPGFTAVLDASELVVDAPKGVDYNGIPVLLSRDARGDVHAIAATCTHRGAPLEVGNISEGCVVCPWHGSRFSLADGTVVEGPATYALARFETRVEAGQIELRPIMT